ncbi:hypothetical protein GN956_G1657 [Arapaima gigas]
MYAGTGIPEVLGVKAEEGWVPGSKEPCGVLDECSTPSCPDTQTAPCFLSVCPSVDQGRLYSHCHTPIRTWDGDPPGPVQMNVLMMMGPGHCEAGVSVRRTVKGDSSRVDTGRNWICVS